MARFLFVLIPVVGLLGGIPAQEKKEDHKKFELSKEEQGVIDLTNAERTAAELKPLAMNPKLMAAARSHAENMATQDKLEHELDGKKPAERVKEAGYIYRATGENIAWNAKSPKEVVKGWMDSPPHKENVLKPEYTEIGVAVARNKKGEGYWVQIFGTPRNK